MSQELSKILPEWLEAAATPGVLTGLFLFSLAMLVATVVGVPWFFCRIPPDHFLQEDRRSIVAAPDESKWRPLFIVGKNVVGVLLVLVGVLLLFLPGQGLLTIIVGLLLVNFPGKRRFEEWLISREPIYRGINLLRRRAHQEPLLKPVRRAHG
jgi:hypothetical protein